MHKNKTYLQSGAILSARPWRSNLLLHFISYIRICISSRIWFWLRLGGSWFTYLQFSLFIFWTGGDMVSYERPIWEFVFDRVAAPDKKSILLVMYSDLFTARSRTSSAACRKSLQIPTRVGPTSFSLEWFFVDFLVGNFFRVDFFYFSDILFNLRF